jgi:hypothetical protein
MELSGIMSEAELHILRGRMLAGARSQARRGELFNHAPIGYARVPGGGLMLDPDEQARDVVRLVFDKFGELGTVSARLRYLVRNGIRLGVRPHFGPDKGGLAWRRPNRTTLTFRLHHPVDAGAYTRGRRPTDPRRKVPGRPATGRVVVPRDEWEVLIHDHLPGSITWEHSESNLRRLAQNGARAGAMRAAREGDSLLAGLVSCGRCGRRMMVASTGQEGLLRYSGQRGALDDAEPVCQSLAGGPLDELVDRQVLLALEPAAVELSLRAVGDAPGERDRRDRQWRLRRERCRYEAERAARQYQACEPENRMVGRELERRWDQARIEPRNAEDEYDRFRRGLPAELTGDEVNMIKCVINMDVMRCQTPEMVRKEIGMHLLAYNLIRGVMVDAAEAHGQKPRHLSFKGALQTMTAFQDALRWATSSNREHLMGEMLKAIASHQVGDRFGRTEPRANKRRPKQQRYLMEPRREACKALLAAA